jgi:hypothetical protein
MADIDILIRARSVDLITLEEFREKSMQIKLPKPESMKCDAEDLFLFYGLNHVDGRMVAARFLNHLAKNGYDFQIARPLELDCPDFTLNSFSRIPQEIINKVAVSADRRPGTTDLLSYSDGHLKIVENTGKIHFYVRGALPESSSFSIRARQGAEDKSALYTDFVKSLE